MKDLDDIVPPEDMFIEDPNQEVQSKERNPVIKESEGKKKEQHKKKHHKQKSFKSGDKDVKFNSYNGRRDNDKALAFIRQFEVAFAEGNFKERSKLRHVDEGEPLTYKEAKTCEHSSKWELAMQEEIKALHANDTWDLVELPKAAALDLKLDQMDVHTVFLHGDVEEELYMKQPEGFVISRKEHLVCKLNRSLYGLKQASRQSYKKFDTFMLKHGYKRSHADHCLYIKRDEDGTPIMLVLYVDDMLIAAKKQSTVDALKEQLKSAFSMKDVTDLDTPSRKSSTKHQRYPLQDSSQFTEETTLARRSSVPR
ncbi:hypothetical protein L7F22_069441 [Adiantum nelumboides]|nr:hypothetical protein [Adiantum nelumboides]